MVCSVSLHLGLLVEPSTGCVGLLVVRSVSPAGSHHAPAVSHQSRHTQGPPPPAWSRPSRAVSGSRSWSSEFPAKEKQHSRYKWHFEIMLHAGNSFVSSLQTARLVSRRLRSGWLRFLVATDCRGGALEVSHTALGAMEYTWGWFEVGLSDLNRGRAGLRTLQPCYRQSLYIELISSIHWGRRCKQAIKTTILAQKGAGLE